MSLCQNQQETFVRIKPQKTRHDITKLDLTILLLSLWYIDIDLGIQPMFFYIVHDLGALGVVKKIQVMGSL